MVAFPAAFFVALLGSALPALFPTAHRYSAKGIAYNVAVVIFGGTAPFIFATLIQATGNADAGLLPHGDVGHRGGCHLLPAGSREAAPARLHA